MRVDSVERNICERVRLARLARRMSQRALGDAIGVTFQQIQKYENGSNRISAGRLVKIAEALSMDVRDLLRGEISDGSRAVREAASRVPLLEQTDVDIVQAISSIPNPNLKSALRHLVVLLWVACADISAHPPPPPPPLGPASGSD